MSDDETSATPTGSQRAGGPAADEEAAADLSRAAREAVRQPPDPRLEASFARLGLWSEPEPADKAAPPVARSSASDGADAARAELDELRATLQALQVTVERLNRRTQLGLWLDLAALVAIAAVAALVVTGART